MKTTILALTTLMLTSTAFGRSPIPRFQAPTARLVATLSTGYVESLRLNLTFEQHGENKWKLERFMGCDSFPCEEGDNTIRSLASVTKVEDLRGTDGNLSIELSNGMNIVCTSGFEHPSSRKKTPCSVSFVEKGQPVTLDLYLQAHIQTH